MNALTFFFKSSLSLIAYIFPLFQRLEAVCKNVLLWPAVFEDGIATLAVWRVVDALVALRTTGRGSNMLLSSVGASPWYIRWNKVSASGCMAFLLRDASGVVIAIFTAVHCIERHYPTYIVGDST